MKKLFILSIVALTIVFHSFAKTTSTKDSGKEESVASYIYHNKSKVVWTSTKEFNVANFTKNGYRMKAYFNEENQLVSTTRYLKSRSELPQTALDNLDRQYPDWGMTDLFEEEGLENETVYYARITDGANTLILKIRQNGELSKFK